MSLRAKRGGGNLLGVWGIAYSKEYDVVVKNKNAPRNDIFERMD
jgi:hypothetical protein